ncbi:non-specific lipid-transfer protein 1-like [Musa acuminata AAA Group]|uniref:non-specific lipid-transfer protein 1-like n=1 Tax=Musa acuminata AAA Group TaxID=214697 RepID=UPI0031D1AFF8
MARLLFLVAILAAAMLRASSDTHTDCGIAQTAFGECVPYVTGKDPSLSDQCCSGVKSIKELTPTVEDRRAICACLVQELKDAGGSVDSSKAKGLAGGCGVSTNVIPTSLSFDCSKIA